VKYDNRSFLTIVSVCVVGLLMVSIAGCPGKNNSTASPTVQTSSTPQVSNNGYDPLLATLDSKLKAAYAADAIITKRLPKNAEQSRDKLVASISLPNGDNVTALFWNDSSVAQASKDYQILAKNDSSTSGPAKPTYFGQDAVKAALGYSPAVVQDTALLLNSGGAPPTPVDYEVIQYGTLVVTINHIWPNSGA